MDKLELAAEVLQFLDVPLVVLRARNQLQPQQCREVDLKQRLQQLSEDIDHVKLQEYRRLEQLYQDDDHFRMDQKRAEELSKDKLWKALLSRRKELEAQARETNQQIESLRLAGQLSDGTELGLLSATSTVTADNSNDEDTHPEPSNYLNWTARDDLILLEVLSDARTAVAHEANKRSSSTTIWNPCICGQCRTTNCEARLNLLRWAIFRNPNRQSQTDYSLFYSAMFGLSDGWMSSIVGNVEDCGLAYLESVLPIDLVNPQRTRACLSCKGFGTLFFGQATSSAEPPRRMPLYRIKAAAKVCAFCRLLCQAIEDIVRPSNLYSFRSSTYTIRFQAVNCILRTNQSSKSGPWKRNGPAEKLAIMKFDPPPFPLQNATMILHSIALSSTAGSFASGRIVPDTQIHLPLLKRWLSECIATHGEACNGHHLPNADGKLHSLRVVDVLEYRIVREASALRYVALSYVWGQTSTLQLTQANEAELCQPGALVDHMSRMPNTILDAFEAVKAMGERYLWVDALCIIQDAGDKETHLQDMHLVYGAALLTIVAGHGHDASAGLPGIHPFSRLQNQRFEKINSDVGVAVSLPLPDAISSSSWSSRAWTYQEQLLSRRFLLFNGDQVIWQCPCEVNCEDTLAENKTKVYERLQIMSTPADALTNASSDQRLDAQYGFRRPPAFQRYTDVVAEYTGRQLTFPEDVLRAFNGLSKIFMLELNTELIEGLPLAFLDAALLWQPRHRLCRRKGKETFASWSWVGWEGRVAYEDPSVRNNVEGIIPLVKWNLHRSELVNKSGIGTRPYLLDSDYEASKWSTPFEPSENDETRSGGGTANTVRLKFWTSCAFFQNLVERRHNKDVHSHTTGLSQAMPLQFQIRSRGGQPVGVLTMTGSVKLDPLRHEYIVLSGAQFVGIDMISWTPRFSAEQGGSLMYNVMLIEWDAEKTCAYRVGLGRIMKTAWEQAKPCNKHITLG